MVLAVSQDQAGPEGESERASPGTGEAGDRGSRQGRAAADSGGVATLWYLAADGVLRNAPVRSGLTNGVSTAITSRSEDVRAGLRVIAAVTTASADATVENPFQSQQQQPGPPGQGGVR
jgi:hypothetical protein